MHIRHLIFFSPYITDHVFNIVDQRIKLVNIAVQNALLTDVIISLTINTVAFFPILITVFPTVGPFLIIGDPIPPLSLGPSSPCLFQQV